MDSPLLPGGRCEPGGLLGSIIARDSAQVLRLSPIYGLLDGSREIDVQHVRAGWAVSSYCRESARIIFGDSIGNPIADRLLAAVRSAGDAGLTGRELDRALSGHGSKARVDAARSDLERRGLVKTSTEQTGGRPIVRTVACQQADKEEQADKARKRLSRTADKAEQVSESECPPPDDSVFMDDDEAAVV
jgi:hypothetical protein